MPSWRHGDLTANGIRLHYVRTGTGTPDGKPALVLAHGFSDDGLCWTPVAEALEAEYDVIMVDARGHGRSDGPESGYGSAEHAADLEGAIRELGLRRPAILGHSMGAATTLALAGTYPGVAGAILLEDPPARWMPELATAPAGAGRVPRSRSWVVDLKRRTFDELVAGQREQSPQWSEAELGPWAESKLRLSFYTVTGAEEQPVDWPAAMRSITCPALLITADPARGAIVSEEQAQSLQTLVPHLQVTHIPDAGHNIRRDQFERYMQSVRAFLGEALPAA